MSDEPNEIKEIFFPDPVVPLEGKQYCEPCDAGAFPEALFDEKKRRWPWASFPEDGSTWEECLKEIDALRGALEMFKNEFEFKAKAAVAAKTTHYSYTVRSLEEFAKACADTLKLEGQSK